MSNCDIVGPLFSHIKHRVQIGNNVSNQRSYPVYLCFKLIENQGAFFTPNLCDNPF